MIIDTRMVRDELDVLQMALEELDGKADYHVVSEAAVDFHGRPKPLYLTDELASKSGRFWRWKDRLEVVVSHTLPDHENPWVREHAQRDAMMGVLRNIAVTGDLILICDGDEIPSDRALAEFDPPLMAPAGLTMRTAHSAVDWLYPAEAPGSVLAPWGVIPSLSTVRDGRPGYRTITGGGWHFSWLGGQEKQAEKLSVSCHLELPQEEKDILASGLGYRNGYHVGVQMVPVDVDDTWPAMIRERRCPASWFRPR